VVSRGVERLLRVVAGRVLEGSVAAAARQLVTGAAVVFLLQAGVAQRTVPGVLAFAAVAVAGERGAQRRRVVHRRVVAGVDARRLERGGDRPHVGDRAL